MARDKKLTIDHYRKSSTSIAKRERVNLYVKITYNRKTTRIRSYTTQSPINKMSKDLVERIIENDIRIINLLFDYYSRNKEFDVNLLNQKGNSEIQILTNSLFMGLHEITDRLVDSFIINKGWTKTYEFVKQLAIQELITEYWLSVKEIAPNIHNQIFNQDSFYQKAIRVCEVIEKEISEERYCITMVDLTDPILANRFVIELRKHNLDITPEKLLEKTINTALKTRSV